MKSVYLTTTCLVSLATATRNFAALAYGDAIPKEAVAQNCDFPAYYTVSNFKTFTPTSSNETEITFGYLDNDTNITTTCSLNSTSTNIASEYSTPKYACDNSLVDFYWSNKKLTMVEVACSTSPEHYLVSGSWIPTLSCQNCTDGVECATTGNETAHQGTFTSIEPDNSE
ncbi:hypothetical protein VM1G_01794 [Cytospora mali]|uniref:AA1-like domain-containing protein n=1 Tax=Cytospora mali TaxID=578113 RepID=A0A194VP96_CYTMA|nr:hypothetical protein VM1G_01794 [Valsa mali]